MFKNFKNNISDLAYSAVNYAENVLSTATGQEKKQAAISFVVSKLAIPSTFKPIVILLFTNFIDNAIEKAVEYMHKVRNED